MVKNNKKPIRATGKKVPLPKKAVSRKIWIQRIGAKQWVLLSVALFLLLILGFIGFNKYQIVQEKKQFDAAEAGLDVLYADIVKALGEPVSHEKDVSCGYSSAKLYKGFLRCGTRYNLEYPALNSSEADKLSNSIMGVVSSNKELTISYKRDYSFTENTKTVSDYPVVEFIANNISKLSCSLANYYSDNANLSVSFGCSELAKAEHYPLRD